MTKKTATGWLLDVYISRENAVLWIKLKNGKKLRLIDNFKPHSWHEANDEIVVCREKRLEDDLVLSREVVLSKTDGLLRDEKYCVRLYAPEQITRLLTASGFLSVHIHRGYTSHQQSSDYGFMTKRMFVIANKPTL